MRRAPLLLLVAVLILFSTTDAAEVKEIIYQEDFSSNPYWETNNPRTNNWDRQFERYHYWMQDATGAYVYREIPYAGGSFRLEFDLRQMRSDKESNLRFGLGDRDMFPDSGSTLYFELFHEREGRLFNVCSIDQKNSRIEASSHQSSYGGTTVRFLDNVTYHVVLDYNDDLRIATIAVEKGVDGTLLWKHTVAGIGGYTGLNRIYLSTRNDVENWESVAEGVIDNVYLYSYGPRSESRLSAAEPTAELPQQTPSPPPPSLSVADRTSPGPTPRAAASGGLPLVALTTALLFTTMRSRRR